MNTQMDQMGQAITEITRTSEETGEIIKIIYEIASASEEQSQGITQVSQAVAEMDREVQQNAAAAEESAAASEELNVQTAQMRNMVDDLVILVEILAQGKDLKPKVYPLFTLPPSSVRRPTGSLPHLRGGFQ